MAGRNGSGSFSFTSNTWNPAVPGVAILSDDWNTIASEIATGLTTSIASDGQTPCSARIPFAQGISVALGALATPGFAFTGDLNTGIYSPGADQMTLVCGGVAVAVATTTGVSFPVAVTYTDITVSGVFTANGNIILGNASGDTLTVNATGTFAGNQTFNGTATFTSTVTVPDATFTNAKLANMATQTFKGRATAGTGVPEDLTATQATAILNAVVGDSGSGGTKGLVPAPAAGDAAKKLYLNAGGTFSNEVKAFGLFVGATGASAGTPFNISCVRNSPSNYTFTFGTALADANYVLIIIPSGNDSGAAYIPAVSSKTASGFVVQTNFNSGGSTAGYDPTQINVTVLA